jgi:hypothetical protein
MNESADDAKNDEQTRRAIEVAIRLALVAGLVYWCFLLFEPFLLLVV